MFAHAIEGVTSLEGVAPSGNGVPVPEVAPTEAQLSARRLRHLSEIGLALSAERDIRRLLAMILTASRELTNADGGTLYIVQKDPVSGDKKLYFRAAQNDSITVDTNMSFAVGASSLAGYAALSGKVICHDDVYHLPDDAPYQFNQRFDLEHGYRTKSVLVVPLRDHNSETIGVLQLINRKRNRATILRDAATVEREVVGFDSEGQDLAETLASQAAVALNNNLLLQEIETLFEQFVVASSSAIEDRDPTTSGHSKRVTEFTLALAEAVNDTVTGPYARVHFSPAQLRELRYAALLHDFGKIGVREAILTKDAKIEATRFEAIQSRVAILSAQREAELAKAKLNLALSETLSPTQKHAQRVRLEADAQQATQSLQSDTRWMSLLNNPVTSPSESEWGEAMEALDRLCALNFCDLTGISHPILEESEAQALKVRRGTLTPSEFAAIQEHAQMSWDFLVQIPWTRGLENVPAIAQAHHERLDGSGYPLGLNEQTIPLGSKIMGIADVFDALTANDRPYRRAMTPEGALRILKCEVMAGKLDGDLLDIFIASDAWRI